jgi:hypothetical protein
MLAVGDAMVYPHLTFKQLSSITSTSLLSVVNAIIPINLGHQAVHCALGGHGGILRSGARLGGQRGQKIADDADGYFSIAQQTI